MKEHRVLVPVGIMRLAKKTHDVITECDALARFRKMVRRWAKAALGLDLAFNRWLDGRLRYFDELSKLPVRSALRNVDFGPPSSSHSYESQLIATGDLIEGWVPCKHAMCGAPPNPRGFPLERGRELSLEDRYAILAAIHDVALPGVRLVTPWSLEDRRRETLGSMSGWHLFEMHMGHVCQLDESHEASLQVFLDEVVRDVAAHCRAAGQGGPQEEKPKPSDLIAIATALQKYHVSRTTIRRLMKAGKLTDYREPDHARNAKLVLSESELDRCFPRKPPL